MKSRNSYLLRLLGILLALAVIATACGDDDSGDGGDSTAPSSEDSGDSGSSDDSESSDGDDSAQSDDSSGSDDGADPAAPVKIGLIAQQDELLAYPEIGAAAQAFVEYFNAELDGAGGSEIILDVCGAGDGPEGHVACAQQFVNDDDVHIVVNGATGSNTAASGAVLVEAGKASLPLGNDFGEFLTPGMFTFDPGIPGLFQVLFVHAADALGARLLVGHDPLGSGDDRHTETADDGR